MTKTKSTLFYTQPVRLVLKITILEKATPAKPVVCKPKYMYEKICIRKYVSQQPTLLHVTIYVNQNSPVVFMEIYFLTLFLRQCMCVSEIHVENLQYIKNLQ